MPPQTMPVQEPDIQPWLQDRSFADWQAEFDETGYLVFENVLTADQLAALRDALAPWLETDLKGRNDFEGLKSNRVYAMLAKSPVFADLAIHPLALAFAEADLGPSCLLSACLAIKLDPGETVQPWHYDDNHLRVPRPRAPFGLSAFWAIDETTEDNGATEILPGSHHWQENTLDGMSETDGFSDRTMRDVNDDPAPHPDALKVTMPAGSLMIAKGTLWHRGGANKSDSPRTIITPQYCPGWARQLENMLLAVPPDVAKTLPPRAQELIGYSIHAPFMGYVDGMHPARTLG